MILTYRALNADDEPILWEMLYHAIHVPHRQSPFPRENLRQSELGRYVAGWGRSTDAGWVVLDEERAVGAAWLRLLNGDQRGYGYVDEGTPELSIALQALYRGQGLGSQLLARLLADAQPRHAAVCLSVSPANPAVQLYQRFGFVAVESSDSSITMLKRWRTTSEG